MFHSNPFNNFDGIAPIDGFSKGLEMDDDGKMEKQSHHLIANNPWEVSRSFSSCIPVPVLNRDHDNSDIACFNYLYSDVGFPPFQSCDEEKIKKLVDGAAAIENPEELNNEAKGERSYAASLHILKNYRKRFRKLNTHKVRMPSYKIECNFIAGQKRSTGAILRLSAETFIQYASNGGAESSATSHPYAYSFAGLSQEDTKDVQLVQYLLASAEKVGSKQFQRAGKLLLKCGKWSSDQGNPIQRLVYYFSGALQERIDRETGTVTPNGVGRKQTKDLLETMGGLTPDIIAMQKHVPFSQVAQFAGIQAILDHVADSTKIHIVDLQIRTGMHYTILMQALATRVVNPLECLKITAIGTKSKARIEKTRDRLANFAQTLNMKLHFNIVMVEDIVDLNETLFELNPDEAVAVWIEFYLMFMIGRQDILESLMTVIKSLNPRIMIVSEVEGNNNSPVFVTRFIESLFHYGGFFDCLEDCLKHDPTNRKYIEFVYFSQAIRNIVATEREERTIRHVAVHVWRSFFKRFGLIQAELSMSSMYQANLVLKNFPCGESCTLDMDGKCLIIGWKGTPIHSLSAWVR